MNRFRNVFIAASVSLGLVAGGGALRADPPQKAKDKKEQKDEQKLEKKQDKGDNKGDKGDKGNKGDKKDQKQAKKGHHNNGKALLGDKIKSNGHHVLGQKGHYTATAEVRDGKVTGVHVKHATKGDIPVKKYKTTKKMALLRTEPVQVATLDPAALQTVTITLYIGYAYYDEEDDYEDIYWFPEDEVYDGDAGAVDYYEPY
jgi:hypothetical protein